MGIYDQMTIEYPALPTGEYQAYVQIVDSYGDFYRIDEGGQLWRLTIGASMGRSHPRLDPPQNLDYTDDALTVYREHDVFDGVPDAFWLTFAHGQLVSWAIHEESQYLG